MQGCLFLRDAQVAALRGQGAIWLRSQCSAGEQGSRPFLSIGQMVALCFVCLILRVPVWAMHLMWKKCVEKNNLATEVEETFRCV